MNARSLVKQVPIVGPALRWISRRFLTRSFPGSEEYWIHRYDAGGNSGAGSYGTLAEFKASVLNTFVKLHSVSSIIEFGCGDGAQLQRSDYPNYLGLDVSPAAIHMCQALFNGDEAKEFRLLKDYRQETAELAISLDVIFHLVEDRLFEEYMARLFKAGGRYVIIYASDINSDAVETAPHVKHRKFTDWVASCCPGWELIDLIPNRYPASRYGDDGSMADFYVYAKNSTGING
jgi:cyclopropane fatty-acyl-phospholipid synthase-like methyltransferase